jgi:enterochelin esterase-like enzyme
VDFFDLHYPNIGYVVGLGSLLEMLLHPTLLGVPLSLSPLADYQLEDQETGVREEETIESFGRLSSLFISLL